MEEDIVRELLDDQSPFLLMPKPAASSPQVEKVSSRETVINKLISKVYSGPTLGDIESALVSTTTTLKRRGGDAPTSMDQNTHSLLANSTLLPEKGYNNKMENKYTLRVKSSGNGIKDDGYKWRKYGQKSIKNSPNPRSYYRCTNPRCNAKRQVERSLEDPDVLVVTYEGLHLHYAYPHFFLARPPQLPQKAFSLAGPSKKPKTQQPLEQQVHRLNEVPNKPAVNHEDVPRAEETSDPNQQGLLEDIVPKLVRNPGVVDECFLDELTSATSSRSRPSSPPSSSSSCFSWSSMPSFFDVSILFANL